jgi:hypothetical protein
MPLLLLPQWPLLLLPCAGARSALQPEAQG